MACNPNDVDNPAFILEKCNTLVLECNGRCGNTAQIGIENSSYCQLTRVASSGSKLSVSHAICWSQMHTLRGSSGLLLARKHVRRPGCCHECTGLRHALPPVIRQIAAH
jgi:hypothetical protein